MDDLSPLIQLVGAKAPQIALWWLGVEKVLKLLQPLLVSRLHAAIERVVSSQDTEDEQLLRRLFEARWYRVTAFALDLAIRLKLPGRTDLDRALDARTSKALALTAALAIGCGALLLGGGCKSPEQAAYRTTGSVVLAVDGAMRAWGDYVRAGLAKPDEEARVLAAYVRYQVGMRVARQVLIEFGQHKADRQALDAAFAVVYSTEGDLIQLIQSLRKSDLYTKPHTP